ncbi:MAG: MFS transporter, partial [Campylobacteraceae bacterium]|nr:MFS transporter [Campylobacteraceae bacterium]
LPTIAHELDVDTNRIILVVAFYMITISTFLIFFGKLGDIFGKIKIFRIGTLFFVLGSILSGFASSLEQLIIFRFFQAIGASMTMATNFGIIAEIFSTEDRAKALGFIGSAVSLGSITGPSVGGLIVEHLSWSYIFWLNAPFGIITMFLGAKYLPKDITKVKTDIDFIGFATYAIFIISFFAMLFLWQEIDFKNKIILTLFVISLIALTVFIKVELTRKMPLLKISIFKNRSITIGLMCAFFTFFSNSAFFILMPFYLQNARGLSPSSAGFFMMIFPLVMVVTSPLAGMFVNKIGAYKMASLGLLVLSFTHGSMILSDIDTSLIFFGLIFAALGFGNAIFQPPNNTIIMSAADKKELGVVGSLNALARNIGISTGIAISTTMLFTAMSYKYGSHITTYIKGRDDLFMFGMHIVFIFTFLTLIGNFILSINRPK